MSGIILVREGKFLKKTSLSHTPHARWLLPASAAQYSVRFFTRKHFIGDFGRI